MNLLIAVREGDLENVRRILRQEPQSVSARDNDGATPLHYAAESGHREIVRALLDAGADINARDGRFGATPAGWAIEYLRQRGALLGMEIEDVAWAIAKGDEELVRRWVTRLPALRDAIDRAGTPLRTHAKNSCNRGIARLFDV